MGILSKLMGLFGGKVGLWAALGAILLIAGMFGYIKYINVEHARITQELEIKRKELEDRDALIVNLQEEKALYELKVQEMVKAMASLQEKMASNSQVRRTDYTRMTSPKPQHGVPLDLSSVEEQANAGMNALFAELVTMSRIEGTTK